MSTNHTTVSKKTAREGGSSPNFEAVKNVPKIIISSNIVEPCAFDSNATHPFYYEASGHDELPHVVKFSGGRSSGMLLFMLLENGLLNQKRGDVIIFNDTSAEHPETYKFTAKCKRVAEEQYGIPFFWIQFQTYEDARSGKWTRFPTYRLVKPVPWSEDEQDGYHWRGEVFEELLSWAGYVPNQFQRTCTQNLKLEITRQFLSDWFACKDGIDRLGHYGDESRIDDDDLYENHIKHKGQVPKEIFLEKKSYVRSRPLFRPKQTFSDYSSATRSIDNPYLSSKQFGGSAYFGDKGVEYITFVGLRYDEMRRVIKVQRRNSGGPEANGYEGEHVYMPLARIAVTKEDVDDFWASQHWGLNLPSEAGLSNCVYCFMKGAKTLHQVHNYMETDKKNGTSEIDSPCDINWWKRMEHRYGRDLKAENRKIHKQERADSVIGFFKLGSGFSYNILEKSDSGKVDISKFNKTVLPCDCTD